ncbi:MAG: Xaa-Pro peptidase family protein [Candidatus Bipolaricaulis sp.]|nr:Xaa-Pro peptidase family protein [Candidatus Bipolaricaulis sp.]MDD5219735.1 Xaa-Pro peptidase family protein [Candidatus Bipolaricaulis sp.]MDD5645901.1 Xaa-Pro peptidase family protein [Candidatus Bipolaricaulis sp.]
MAEAQTLESQKASQACGILRELDIDCWLLWVRETMQLRDPSLDLVLGSDVIGPTALLFTQDGERIAIAQEHDAAGFPEGLFDRTIPYTAGIAEPLSRELHRLDPQCVALNYSVDNDAADGLTVGMLELLRRILTGTEYPDRFVSAGPLVERLRGRKLPEEVERIRGAISVTERIFDDLRAVLRVGQTEREIAELVRTRMRELAVEPSWDPSYCPAVDAGPDKEFGHAGPTGRLTRPGHLLHFDFGVRARGYCADLQRMYFFGRRDEIPAPIQEAFAVVREAIESAAAFLCPGRLGYEVDAVARDVVLRHGYVEYAHGLGHTIGRFAHDGGMRLAPLWPIFGERPKGIVEVGHVFTLELGVPTPEHGRVNLEEDVLVTADGCTFLSHPQEEIFCIG